MSREWVRTMDMAFKLQENNKKKKKQRKEKKRTPLKSSLKMRK
jgi:hypothetical protein